MNSITNISGHQTYFIMFYTAYIVAWIDLNIHKVDREVTKGQAESAIRLGKKYK